MDGAYAGFAEDLFGRLGQGQQADFIIVDRNPLDINPSELRATQVEETWIGGQKVWSGADKISRSAVETRQIG